MFRLFRSCGLLFLLFCFSVSGSSQSHQAPDSGKLVELAGFQVKGTRIPTESIIRLSALKVGQKVNYAIIDQACHKITSTGLVKLIDYAYEVQPGKPGIVLSFTLVDELPLFPAKILPAEDTDRIWQCLESSDPIFTRELPNTSNALKFYTTNINRCIQIHGQHDAYVHASVACDVHGNAAQIVFDILPRQSLPTK